VSAANATMRVYIDFKFLRSFFFTMDVSAEYFDNKQHCKRAELLSLNLVTGRLCYTLSVACVTCHTYNVSQTYVLKHYSYT
jgi:hypothetical protein